MNRRAGTRTVVLGLVLLVAGCGAGSGEGLDSTGNLPGTGTGGGGGGGGASGNPSATLNWVQTNVFSGVCITCHGGAAPQAGLSWANACANVDKFSSQITTLKEIDSGRPNTSYVIWKLEGVGPPPDNQPIVGARMPAGCSGTSCLSPDTIRNIRDWIADGTPGC